MAGRYAASTAVSSEQSQVEIERTLSRFGASGFMRGWSDGRAVVAFVYEGRQIRFTLPMPDRNAPEFTQTPSKKWERSPAEAEKAYEQAVRQRWRALLLVIKAKLEAVASGIVTMEDEWMPYVVLPDGRTVAEHVQPRIDLAYETGSVPELVPDYSGRELPAGRS